MTNKTKRDLHIAHYTHVRPRAHTHTRIHAPTQANTHTHTHTHTHITKHTHQTHTYMHPHRQTHTHADENTYSCVVNCPSLLVFSLQSSLASFFSLTLFSINSFVFTIWHFSSCNCVCFNSSCGCGWIWMVYKISPTHLCSIKLQLQLPNCQVEGVNTFRTDPRWLEFLNCNNSRKYLTVKTVWKGGHVGQDCGLSWCPNF